MIELITDIKAPNANSYADLCYANTFFEQSFYGSEWRDLKDEDKKRLLIEATKRLDFMDFDGEIEDINQSLQFPRVGMELIKGRDYNNIIPSQIKDAQCMLALNLKNINMNEFGNSVESLSSVKVGAIEVKFQDNDTYSGGVNNNELPPYVKTILNMFTYNGGTISWRR